MPKTKTPRRPPVEQEEWLTVSGAAALLQVHIDTVRRWEKAGIISAVRQPGGWRRFRRSDLEAVLSR